MCWEQKKRVEVSSKVSAPSSWKDEVTVHWDENDWEKDKFGEESKSTILDI